MRVEQTRHFSPVTITIENLDEAKALFAVCNYCPVGDWLKKNGFDIHAITEALSRDAYDNGLPTQSLQASIQKEVKRLLG